MSPPENYKLVRDLIPELIQESGQKCDFGVLKDTEILSSLSEKLLEEVKEFLDTQNNEEWLEEMADIQEVLHGLLNAKGFSFSQLEEKRLEKRKSRGGFDKKYYLKAPGELAGNGEMKESKTACLFCRLKKEESILRFKHCRAIWDRYPVSKGHLLIIPYNHYRHWFDAPKQVQQDIIAALSEAKVYLDEKHKPDGYNVGFNCGAASGQTVDHLHIHIIPRYQGDVPDPTGGVRGVIPAMQRYEISEKSNPQSGSS